MPDLLLKKSEKKLEKRSLKNILKTKIPAFKILAFQHMVVDMCLIKALIRPRFI